MILYCKTKPLILVEIKIRIYLFASGDRVRLRENCSNYGKHLTVFFPSLVGDYVKYEIGYDGKCM